MREYILAVLLERKETDEEFGRWPLHITMVPWFEVEQPERALAAVQRVAMIQNKLNLIVGEDALLGPNKTVPVSLIKNSQPLISLHNMLVGELEALDATFPHPHYMRERYHPHISHRAYAKVQRGYKLEVDRIYLIEAPIANRLIRKKKVIGFGELHVNPA